MNAPDAILDSDKVVAHFGEWPHFHDMEVVSLRMDRRGAEGPWIEFVVFAWTYTGRLTPTGHYEQHRHALIRFRCDDLGENQLNGFNNQNVLDGLVVGRSESDVSMVYVRLPAIFGLGGLIECRRVRVVDVTPATPSGEAVTPEPEVPT